MVQAARSGVQNIAEGSQASGTSKKTELKLTNVARSSLEELRLDYEDFLRQRSLPLWGRRDARRAALIDRRPANVEAVAAWIRDVRGRAAAGGGRGGLHGRSGQSTASTKSITSTPSSAEIAANGALALIAVACSLLDRQLASLARSFEEEGGFTERLYNRRKTKKGSK